MPKIELRPLKVTPDSFPKEWHPMVRRLYAARMVSVAEADKSVKNLLPPKGIPDIEKAATRMMAAIDNGEDILIYGDYDVDGATSTALMVRVLRVLGAKVRFFIPNRWQHGYGLSIKGIEAFGQYPQLLITVDNGSMSFEAVDSLKTQGVDVIITDHHDIGESLPSAYAVINPKRAGSTFASPNLAGVGVAFYMLLALREAYLKAARDFPVNLWQYLDIVAMGTVADIVPLDRNNRILVSYGLYLIRSGKGNLGIRALCEAANVSLSQLCSDNIAYALGPRLNAVGRLENMSDGVAMLLADDYATCQDYAQLLDGLNRDRKALESEMTAQAQQLVNPELPVACAYQADWHEGVIGIVASRLKAKFARPVMVATNTTETTIKASLRSVAGVNIHQLLALAAAKLPQDCIQFGGHAMAAGLSVDKTRYKDLVVALSNSFYEMVGQTIPEEPVYSDGSLDGELLDISWAKYLEHLEPWGASLPQPTFSNTFYVQDCRRLGAEHTRLVLRLPDNGKLYQAAWFFHQANFNYGDKLEVVYRVQVNRFYGDERLDLLVNYAGRD